ncbi:MAG: chemotaxis protein, partial [Rhodoferax sp.]|nr:chemotaxis protein [Rhodoferax sp.]
MAEAKPSIAHPADARAAAPFGLLAPGVWLMRRLRLGGKFGLLAVVTGVVLAAAAFAPAVTTAPGWVGTLLATGVCLIGYLMLSFRASFLADFEMIMAVMQKTTQGDLRMRASVGGRDELASMAALLDRMVLTLSAMVADIRSNAALVAHAGRSLAAGNRDLADRTEQQAANLEQTAASVEQLSSTVQQNAQTAQAADVRAGQVRQAAQGGADAMHRAVASVEAIQQGAKRMGEIIGVIDGIAFQTNILALNAAVEAARAGE